MMRRALLALALIGAVLVTVAAVLVCLTLRRWDLDVTERFQKHRWNFPSKIYSDAALVYPGVDIHAAGLIERLQELHYQRVGDTPARRGEYSLDAERCDVYLRQRSPVDDVGRRIRLALADGRIEAIRDLDSGEELFTFELEPMIITGLFEGVWEERRLVPLSEIPPLLVQAILDTEDQRFHRHRGVDVQGILRALWVNLRSGQVTQGGSTLTQQLMKNFFLTNERSLRRKLREAVMALIIERRFSKEEILENYVNEIYLGQKGAQGIFGIWEAAQFYFAKSPADLTVAEIAMLAGLIRGPNLYSPFRDAESAQRRRNVVLEVMHSLGHIDADTYSLARQEPLRVRTALTRAKDAPYFVDFVRRELAASYPEDLLNREGLRIYTSLDMHLQRVAEQAVQEGLEALERQHPTLSAGQPADQLQACLIAVLPQTGAIRAMMGGRDYRSTQFNRCMQALRQPGSVFKPIVYAAAFEHTRRSASPITTTTEIDDEPFTWPYDGRNWSPANYGRRYLGPTTVREALEHSLNAATARLAYQVGLPSILDLAQRLGISSPLPAYPSVVLGAAEVSPFEVAQVFAAFANGGLRATPLSVQRVLDRSGVSLERTAVELVHALPADTAFLVTHLLTGVLERGTARAARSTGFTRTAAGKTGTTNDYGDAWFVGYTPELLAVVWVGFDERRPLRLSGGEAALPIWTAFMKRATAGLPRTTFVPPAGINVVRIDPDSGLLATARCPQTLDEAFYTGTAPSTPCPLHPVEDGIPTEALPPQAERVDKPTRMAARWSPAGTIGKNSRPPYPMTVP